LPEQIRGFGHVRERHVEHARSRQTALLAAFRSGKPAVDMVGGKPRVTIAVLAG
ncbi:MAG: hypothetical protein JNK52_16265, partial [Zoogloeaceae bacterium]|nr:hypothetical protein [Zoogloeaceae bacterium]